MFLIDSIALCLLHVISCGVAAKITTLNRSDFGKLAHGAYIATMFMVFFAIIIACTCALLFRESEISDMIVKLGICVIEIFFIENCLWGLIDDTLSCE